MALELEYKPDAQRALERMNAWWEGEILDRPTIQVTAPRPNPRPLPQSTHATLRERWMDAEYNVARAAAQIANTYYAGEAMPTFNPNLGPDVQAAPFGMELQFGEDTSWSEPILTDWEMIPRLRFDSQNLYARKIVELTRLGLAAGRGKFLVGITDLHPGGDLAAALRGGQQLCMDLVLEPERVTELMAAIKPAFFEFYELQYRALQESRQSLTSAWLPLYSEGRYYIPSNDFSCMISAEMFREFFVEEIRAECAWLDRSCYHLDGPAATRHLDALLEIEDLDAIQFVYGAGNEPAARWLDVYRRIQDSGKRLQMSIGPDEIDAVMDALRPEGVMISTWAKDMAHADAIVAKAAKWRRSGVVV